MVQYSDEVRLGSAGIPHLVQWRGGFGDMAVKNAAGHQATIHYDSTKREARHARLPNRPRTGPCAPMVVFLRRHRRSVLHRGLSAAAATRRCRPPLTMTWSLRPPIPRNSRFPASRSAASTQSARALRGPEGTQRAPQGEPQAGGHHRLGLVRHYREAAVSWCCSG